MYIIWSRSGPVLVPEDIEDEMTIDKAQNGTVIVCPPKENHGEIEEFLVVDRVVCLRIKRVKEADKFPFEETRSVKKRRFLWWKF